MDIRDLFPDLRGNKPAPKPEDRRERSHTKSGPGRKHLQGAKTDDKSTASLKAGAYGRGLRNHFNRVNLKRCKRMGPTDKHGAITMVGWNPLDWSRRVWLAGISAMRGF